MYIKVLLIITTIIFLLECSASKKVNYIEPKKQSSTKLDSIEKPQVVNIDSLFKFPGILITPPDPPKLHILTTPKLVIYDEEPIPIKTVYPQYPEFVKKKCIEGTVIIQAEILEDGTVGAVEIIKSIHPGPGGLDEEAIKAIKQWKFIPAKNKGKPVAVWITIPIEFDF